MNILFFLTPKNDVAYLYDDFTVRQALEKIEHHHYTAVPVINRKGMYIGTLTEGDLLFALKSIPNLSFKDIEKLKINEISLSTHNKTVGINSQMENLFQLSIDQNFIPVINDDGIFIGIVTRKAILKYCYNKYFKTLNNVK